MVFSFTSVISREVNIKCNNNDKYSIRSFRYKGIDSVGLIDLRNNLWLTMSEDNIAKCSISGKDFAMGTTKPVEVIAFGSTTEAGKASYSDIFICFCKISPNLLDGCYYKKWNDDIFTCHKGNIVIDFAKKK